jgi:hypothetical protein
VRCLSLRPLSLRPLSLVLHRVSPPSSHPLGWQAPLDDRPLADRNCGDLEVGFERPGLVGFGHV